MNIILIIMFFSFFDVRANELVSRIIHIDFNDDKDKSSLVYLESGRIVKTSDSRIKKLLEGINVANHRIKFKIDNQREIKNVVFVLNEEVEKNVFDYSPDSFSPETFTPSILKNMDQARLLFSQAKVTYKESQCYDKAHAWAYDWRIQSNVYSSKIWIFFTRKYIREFDYGWWFHVAPMVHVVHEESVKERVMDPTYAKGPLKINNWSDIFMKNRSKCPVVTKYDDHANYPESAYCFLMKSSMYYYQPIDLELKDLKGIIRNKWIESEVRFAFEHAFNIKI